VESFFHTQEVEDDSVASAASAVVAAAASASSSAGSSAAACQEARSWAPSCRRVPCHPFGWVACLPCWTFACVAASSSVAVVAVAAAAVVVVVVAAAAVVDAGSLVLKDFVEPKKINMKSMEIF